MTRNTSQRETADLQPLLDYSDSNETFQNDFVVRRRIRRKTAIWMVGVGVVAVLLLIVHILFVARLRKTTVTLEQVTLPDLCHCRTMGDVVMKFENPSYCSPVVGPLNITFTTKNMAFLHIHVASFELQSGITTIMLSLDFDLLTSPETLYSLVFVDGKNIDVHGQVPVLISCMLVPFTIHLDVSNLLRATPQPPVDTFFPMRGDNALGLPLYRADAWKSGIVNGIMTELEHVVKQVLKTIALSHFHTKTNDQEIFAFTDVSLEYASMVLWNIPSLSVKVESVERQTILVAGIKRFLLGNGKTFIYAYTDVLKNQSEPLQSMLQSYLAGNDVALHVSGSNRDTDCYSLQVLDHVDVKINIPAMIDNKPALIREYSIQPVLKELDSKTHKCLLEIKVYFKINNPLPIRFDFYGIELDLLYEKVLLEDSCKPKFLHHVKYIEHVSWAPHEENSIVLSTAIHGFDTCMEVVDFFLHNQLAFDIQHGCISMGAGNGNFSIPFSTKGIRIHPIWSNTSSVVAKSES
ncbi:unnamed protein product [Peronospora belbahrii]|uniref:Uncharacterized protein n=1 Tax=Peronospora belbahrii TaxID=622444 RepID=A0AAU9L2D0_9STRA|nr:unnamed protein product [Peronospora belbahrii]CAH0519806.1 unnamed protein product [Peronospora belbahrii]